MTSKFRSPHTPEVAMVSECARRYKNFEALSAKELRNVLGCYHWYRYQKERNWPLPDWFTTHINKYVTFIYRSKRWSDAAAWANESHSRFEYI